MSLNLLLDGDEQFRPDAHPYDGRTIASVRSSVISADCWTIQSTDPRALRRLAAALTEAADKADKLRIAA